MYMEILKINEFIASFFFKNFKVSSVGLRFLQFMENGEDQICCY